MSRPKVYFGDPRHRTTGYLSNSARGYIFEVDGKWWPTVDHYVQGMKFKGTQLEDSLRLTPSRWKMRGVARGACATAVVNGRLRKTRLYGDGSVAATAGWRDQAEALYRTAITEKFYQNRAIVQRLLHTGEAELIDATCAYTGPLLEKIRAQCRREKNQKYFLKTRADLALSPDTKDTHDARIDSGARSVVDALIEVALQIAQDSGQEYVYSQIVEDAIAALFPDRAEYIVALCHTRPLDALAAMPNFSKIVSTVYAIFCERDPFQKYDMTGARLVAEVVRWMRVYAMPAEVQNMVARAAADDLRGVAAVFPQKKNRWYRAFAPPIPLQKAPLGSDVSRALDADAAPSPRADANSPQPPDSADPPSSPKPSSSSLPVPGSLPAPSSSSLPMPGSLPAPSLPGSLPAPGSPKSTRPSPLKTPLAHPPSQPQSPSVVPPSGVPSDAPLSGVPSDVPLSGVPSVVPSSGVPSVVPPPGVQLRTQAPQPPPVHSATARPAAQPLARAVQAYRLAGPSSPQTTAVQAYRPSPPLAQTYGPPPPLAQTYGPVAPSSPQAHHMPASPSGPQTAAAVRGPFGPVPPTHVPLHPQTQSNAGTQTFHRESPRATRHRERRERTSPRSETDGELYP